MVFCIEYAKIISSNCGTRCLAHHFLLLEIGFRGVSTRAWIVFYLFCKPESVLSFRERLANCVLVDWDGQIAAQNLCFVVVRWSGTISCAPQGNRIILQARVKWLEFAFVSKCSLGLVRAWTWRQKPLLAILFNVVNVECLHILTAYTKWIQIILAASDMSHIFRKLTSKQPWHCISIRRRQYFSFLLRRVIVTESHWSLEGSSLIASIIGFVKQLLFIVEHYLGCSLCRRKSGRLTKGEVLLGRRIIDCTTILERLRHFAFVQLLSI